MKLLILRPQPGGSETAARALAMGLEPVVAPLFATIRVAGPPVAAKRYDSVLLTSANGARFAPPGVAGLICFAVGERTASAARAAGFGDVRTGPCDGAAAAAMMAAAGARRALHLCGREHLAVEAPGIEIERRVVYAAEAVAHDGFEGPAVAMIHSARSGARFAELAGERGRDRRRRDQPRRRGARRARDGGRGRRAPRDQALLELAAQLCNHGFDVARDGNGL